jgi:hypothetical protein
MTQAGSKALLLAALALTACRSELPSSVESTLSGSYALITLNGSR